ncbi:MAG: hypothetical protein ACPLTR_05690 [Thermacetogeniaceae bacterium]
MSICRRLKALFRFWERERKVVRLESKVAELQALVHKLSVELSSLTKELAGRPFEMHIDKVLIDKVNLEQLVFHIDEIGVRDLSGALSIGVNYGGRVMRVTNASAEREPRRPQPIAEEKARIKINFCDQGD